MNYIATFTLNFILCLIRICNGQFAEIPLHECRGSSCSLYSYDRRNSSIANNITCRIENESCFNIMRIQDTLASVSPPILKKNKQHWYLFQDQNEMKIALNFSWSPSIDATVELLKGYRISILKRGAIPDSGFERTLYYCMYSEINFHAFQFNSSFFYDCFGKRNEDAIQPGDDFRVIIESIPYPPSDYGRFDTPPGSLEIFIPGCSDSRLFNVRSCVEKRRFIVELNSIDCVTRRANFSYNVPAKYGETATVYITNNYGMSVFNVLQQNLSSDSFIFFLEEKYFFNISYNIIIFGNVDSFTRKTLQFNFSECITDPVTKQTPFFQIGVPIVIVIFVLMLVVVFLYGLFKCDWDLKNLLRKVCCQISNTTAYTDGSFKSGPTNHFEKKGISNDSPEKDGPVKLYIVHATDDNNKHRDVILKFATFLQHDLGFEVIIDLWNCIEVSKDITLWMQDSVNQAHKVLVIWSQEAKGRWKDDCENVKRDMFTPVVRHVKKDLFLSKNPDKYFFGYFPYCDDSGIPEEFQSDHNTANRTFLLMEQFERLYFLLSGFEKFGPGQEKIQNKASFSSYGNPDITTFGLALKEAIANVNKQEEGQDALVPTEDDSPKSQTSVQPEMISISIKQPPLLHNNADEIAENILDGPATQPQVALSGMTSFVNSPRQPQESEDHIPSLEPSIKQTPKPCYQLNPVNTPHVNSSVPLKQATEHSDIPTSSGFFSDEDLNHDYNAGTCNNDDEVWKAQPLPMGYDAHLNDYHTYSDGRPSYEDMDMNTLVSNSIESRSYQYPPPEPTNLPSKPLVKLVPLDMVNDPTTSLSFLNIVVEM